MSEHEAKPEMGFWLSVVQGSTAVPKSFAKLIDTVGEQVGLFLEPVHTRRMGQAEAEVAIIEAKAKAEIKTIQFDNKLAIRELEDRADERIRKQKVKRQKNVEAITFQASKEIPESVSDEPVDEDWVTQFFNHCQDVSNEQMQLLWGRLLAGEVAKPGSFSLRTLAVVRNLSRVDADLFTRFCSMLWQPGTQAQDLRPWTLSFEQIASISGLEIRLQDLVRLATIGLIRFEVGSGGYVIFFQSLNSQPNNESSNEAMVCLHYFGKPHYFRLPTTDSRYANKFQMTSGFALLTDVGSELAEISKPSPNEEYRLAVIANLETQGWKLIV